MSDEITKSQEQAKSLGVYEIVRNIASKGSNTKKPCDAEWEGCRIVFECLGGQVQSNTRNNNSVSSAIGSALSAQVAKNAAVMSAFSTKRTVKEALVAETSIIMPDGTILYRALQKGQVVTDFRYGAWLERIKAYSEQITAEKQRSDEAKAQQEREKKLKPFSGIDF